MRRYFLFVTFALLFVAAFWLSPQPAPAQSGTIPPRTYHTLPADFPQITVTVAAGRGLGDGFLFLNNFRTNNCATSSYLLILTNSGEPVFYRRLPTCTAGLDFKKQSNGLLTYFDSEKDIFVALDNTYAQVDTWATGNGYTTDVHDLQLLPNGNALLMSYDTQVVDNSSGIIPNGRITATVIGLILQELDAAKNVIFEWKSWDHIPISDAYDAHLQREPVDYVHGNAIELDIDGNLLVSNRHLNEITKINRQTGAIIWRLGGKANQFTFLNDPRGFSHQHDVRRLRNGNITLFDNDNFLSPQYSRALEYKLDEVNKTATLIGEYRNTPDTFGGFMGSHQRLSNGNSLVGWGGANVALTEFAPDKTKLLELKLPPGEFSYRAFRQTWAGYPAWEPTLVVVTETVPTLYYSWNGATEIVGYQVYAGVTINADVLIDTALKTGFETSTVLEPQELAQYCYYQVMPIDKQGNKTTYSNVVFLDSPACQPPTETPTVTPTATDTPTETATNTPTPTATSTPLPPTAEPTRTLPAITPTAPNVTVWLPVVRK